MVYCGKCGAQMEDNQKFCPVCGSEVIGETQKQSDLSAKLQDLNNTSDETSSFAKDDINQNKAMSILAYFGPLVLIPIFAAPKSQFARYHSNQGLILLIAEIIYSVIYGVLSSIIFSISWRLYFVVTIIGFLSLVFLALAIVGIVNAASGKAKALPIIGKFTLLK